MQLPPNPSLENLKKQAKGLLKAHRDQDSEVIEYVQRHLPRLADASAQEVLASKLSLQEAQLVVAREYGFPSWPKLVEVVDRLAKSAQGDLPDLFSNGFKRAFELAHEESERLGHDYIGTEYLLLGLVNANRIQVHNLLDGLSLDVDLDQVVRAVVTCPRCLNQLS